MSTRKGGLIFGIVLIWVSEVKFVGSGLELHFETLLPTSLSPGNGFSKELHVYYVL
jgi:hypothetical protein